MIGKTEFLQLMDRYSTIPRRQLIKDVTIAGFCLDVPDSASFLSQAREIFYDREYDFTCLESVPIIVDVGSNIGMSCLFFSALYPGSQIHCYEPDPDIFEFLKNNLSKNLVKNAHLHNNAAWIENTYLFFESTGTDAGHISNETDKVKVQAVDFCKELLRFDKISLLKMDIEGSESEVFPHIKSQLFKVDNLILEYHSGVSNQQTLGTILQILEQSGFRYHIHQVNKRRSALKNRAPAGFFDCQVNIFAYKYETLRE